MFQSRFFAGLKFRLHITPNRFLTTCEHVVFVWRHQFEICHGFWGYNRGGVGPGDAGTTHGIGSNCVRLIVERGDGDTTEISRPPPTKTSHPIREKIPTTNGNTIRNANRNRRAISLSPRFWVRVLLLVSRFRSTLEPTSFALTTNELLVVGLGSDTSVWDSTWGLRALSFSLEPQDEQSIQSGAGEPISTLDAHFGHFSFFIFEIRMGQMGITRILTRDHYEIPITNGVSGCCGRPMRPKSLTILDHS